jgi:hypothetical protein
VQAPVEFWCNPYIHSRKVAEKRQRLKHETKTCSTVGNNNQASTRYILTYRHSTSIILILKIYKSVRLLMLHDSNKPNYQTQPRAQSLRGYDILIRRMASSGMLRCVALVRTEVSEVLSASFTRMTRIDELGSTLAVTSSRSTLRRNTSLRR